MSIDLLKINQSPNSNSLKIDEEENNQIPINSPIATYNTTPLTTKHRMRLAIQRNSRLNQERKAGQPYIPWGTAFRERTEQDLAGVVSKVGEASQKDDWLGASLRGVGWGMNQLTELGEGAKAIAEDPSLSTIGPLGTLSNVALGNTLRIADTVTDTASFLGGKTVKALGGDEQLGQFAGSFIPELLLSKGAGAISKSLKGLSIAGTGQKLAMATNVGSDVLAATQILPDLTNPLKIVAGGSAAVKGVNKASKLDVPPVIKSGDEIIAEAFPNQKSKIHTQLRQTLSGNPTGAAEELRDIVISNRNRLKNAPTVKLTDGRVVPVTQLARHEVQELANQISSLKKQLGIPHTQKFDDILGHFVVDGKLYRLDSKGKLKPIQNLANRKQLETLFPVNEAQLSKRLQTSRARHKHHIRHLKPSEVFGYVQNKSGEFINRSKEQLDRVTKRLQKDGVFIGNQDLNEVMLTAAGHTGKGKYSAHAQLKRLTDVQGRMLADADFIEVILKKGDGKTPVWLRQVKNKQGVVTGFENSAGKVVKANNIGEAVSYRLHGRTYDAGLKHGFSREGLASLSKLKTDDELYNAMKLYYEINDEAYKGSAALAHLIEDAGVTVDTLTKELIQEFAPETQNWIKHLMTKPGYKDDPRLLQALIRNTDLLSKHPKYKDNKKLQALLREKRAFESSLRLRKKIKLPQVQ